MNVAFFLHFFLKSVAKLLPKRIETEKATAYMEISSGNLPHYHADFRCGCPTRI